MRKDLKNNIKNRIGEKRIMNCGEECEIVEYNGATDIMVRFLKSRELIRCQYSNFKGGTIKSHFTPSIYGVGIIGLEKTRDRNNKPLKSYKLWTDMLKRCYDKKLHKKEPTYIGCSVCDEWLYYKNFKEWYNENYYEIDNETICLDKDILVKKNKVYSPETCVFVPRDINLLFIKSNAKRGILPIGVCYNKQNNKYQAYCNMFNVKTNKSNKKHLGCYITSEEAFKIYKKVKEENIKQVADYYREQIPKKLYDAMYRYEVDIDD